MSLSVEEITISKEVDISGVKEADFVKGKKLNEAEIMYLLRSLVSAGEVQEFGAGVRPLLVISRGVEGPGISIVSCVMGQENIDRKVHDDYKNAAKERAAKVIPLFDFSDSKHVCIAEVSELSGHQNFGARRFYKNLVAMLDD